MIWLALLPFSLWTGCRWLMVPVAGTIAFLLLGIDEIGVQLEEPFGILPLGGFPVMHEAQLVLAACCLLRKLVCNAAVQNQWPLPVSACLSIVLAGCRGHLQHHPCKHR